MTPIEANNTRRWRIATVAAVLTAVSTILYVCAPGLAPGVLIGSVLLSLVLSRVDRGALLPRGVDWVFVGPAAAWLAFCTWMLVSTAWSPNFKAGFASAIWCLFAVVVTLTTLHKASDVGPRSRMAVAKAFLIGFLVGVILLLFEAVTSLAGRRLIMSFVPAFTPTMPGATIVDGWVTAVPFYLIKKNTAVVMMMFWPALLITVRLASSAQHRHLIKLATVLSIVAIVLADHDTSKVALAFSAGVWVLAILVPRATKPVAIILWCVVTLAVVPLSLAAFKAEVYNYDGLKFSARHRIVIWGSTAERVLQQPMLGAGLAATRYVDEHTREAVIIPGIDVPKVTNAHSHNVFLQTWHELGAVGALLLCLTGLTTIRSLGREPPGDQPYLFATFATVAVIASLSWSLIAAWFVAAFGMTAILLQLACHVSRDAAATRVDVPSSRRQCEEPVAREVGV